MGGESAPRASPGLTEVARLGVASRGGVQKGGSQTAVDCVAVDHAQHQRSHVSLGGRCSSPSPPLRRRPQLRAVKSERVYLVDGNQVRRACVVCRNAESVFFYGGQHWVRDGDPECAIQRRINRMGAP